MVLYDGGKHAEEVCSNALSLFSSFPPSCGFEQLLVTEKSSQNQFMGWPNPIVPPTSRRSSHNPAFHGTLLGQDVNNPTRGFWTAECPAKQRMSLLVRHTKEAGGGNSANGAASVGREQLSTPPVGGMRGELC